MFMLKKYSKYQLSIGWKIPIRKISTDIYRYLDPSLILRYFGVAVWIPFLGLYMLLHITFTKEICKKNLEGIPSLNAEKSGFLRCYSFLWKKIFHINTYKAVLFLYKNIFLKATKFVINLKTFFSSMQQIFLR